MKIQEIQGPSLTSPRLASDPFRPEGASFIPEGPRLRGVAANGVLCSLRVRYNYKGTITSIHFFRPGGAWRPFFSGDLGVLMRTRKKACVARPAAWLPPTVSQHLTDRRLKGQSLGLAATLKLLVFWLLRESRCKGSFLRLVTSLVEQKAADDFCSKGQLRSR